MCHFTNICNDGNKSRETIYDPKKRRERLDADQTGKHFLVYNTK